MKRFSAAVGAVLVALLASATIWAYNGDEIVYITKTGECYHRENCSYLKSRVEITLQAATDAGYRPCSRCHPPVLETEQSTRTSPSGSGESSSSQRYEVVILDEPETTAPVQSEPEEAAPWWETLPISPVAVVTVGGGAWLARGAVDRGKKRKEEEARALLREEFQQKYGGKTKQQIATLCGMPPGTWIGADGLPHRLLDGKDLYRVYIARSGSRYHSMPHCGGATLFEENAVRVLPYRRACTRCGAPIPDTRWYTEYSQVVTQMRRLGLPEPPDK